MPNSGGVYTWSQTPASNATADNTVNYAEGQAPSSLNDSARAAMASVAKYRDDISGAIVTTGTSTAYIVSSFQQFDSLADMHQKVIAFSPHATNGAGPVTISVDGFSKALRSAPNTELLAGVLIQGTPYLATYNNTDGAWYLQGYYGQPLAIPLFGGMDFWDTIAPNSSFIFPMGQAISRTTYAAAFARWSTKFGAGDGSTTFNVPDKTGRVSAMIEAAASRLTATYFGGDSTQLGSVGASNEKHTLAVSEMPAHNHGVTDPGHTHTSNAQQQRNDVSVASSPSNVPASSLATINSATTGITINSNGGGNPHAIVQPTITCNYIIRII